MRVIVIGSARQRSDLRDELDMTALEVVGEFASLREARDSGIETDAFLIASSTSATDADEASDIESLTPREVEVLELVAEGLPNKVVASRLGISDQTVKFHLASISGKLGALNRTDAVRRAVRRGLISF